MDAAREVVMPAAGQPHEGSSAIPGAQRRHAKPPSLQDTLSTLWDEVRGLLQDQLLLASLESERALAALLRTLILAGVCITLLVGAWASAVAALTVWLVEAGWSVAGALALVGGVTSVLAGGSLWLARRSLRFIAFPATLRRLTNAPLPRSGE